MPNKSISVNTKLPTLHKFPEKKIQLVTQHNHRPICRPPENRFRKKHLVIQVPNVITINTATFLLIC